MSVDWAGEDRAGALPYILIGVVEHPLEGGAVGELLEPVELVDDVEADGRVRIVQGAGQHGDRCVGCRQLVDRGQSLVAHVGVGICAQRFDPGQRGV